MAAYILILKSRFFFFSLLWGFQQRNSQAQKALNWLIHLKRWPCTKRGTWALCGGRRWGHPPVHLAQSVSTFNTKVDVTERLPSLAFLSLSAPCLAISTHLIVQLLNSLQLSNSLQPHGLQHVRLPCPSPSPRVCSDSCLLS